MYDFPIQVYDGFYLTTAYKELETAYKEMLGFGGCSINKNN